MAELNKKALVAEIQHAMKRSRKFHQGMVKQLDKALKESGNLDGYRFGVKLANIWEKGGGKDVSSFGNKDLEQAFRRVIKRFMKVNNCNELQAWWQKVTVKLPCGYAEQLPEEMWRPIAVKVLEDLDPKLAEQWRGRL